MTRVKNLGNIVVGLGMIIAAILLIATEPKMAYQIIIFILCLGLLIVGIKELFFYITMARHMTDGKRLLYRSIIMIDIGIFTLSLTKVPITYVMLYLAGLHLFTGGVAILRALESKRMQAGSWKLQFVMGLVNVILALLCLFYIKSTSIAINIYAIGLIWSGAMRIIQSFRKTEIVYIQ